MATIHPGSESDLFFLGRILADGGIVAVPTETVYGLAAHALDENACRKVFAAKDRPAYDPLIVHVADRAAAEELAEFNPTAEDLARSFWPGPLTLVLPKKEIVPDLVTAGRPSVALRSPAHPLLRKLLEHCGLPLAAPSANLFGSVSPTTAQHVQEALGTRIEHVLDGGPCMVGVESTIVDLRDETDPVILRQGGIPREELEQVIGRTIRVHKRPPGKPGAPANAELAPGMLDRHYSPATPVELREKAFSREELMRAEPRTAFVCFRKPGINESAVNIRWLSEDGTPAEAGRRLFALMRELDDKGFERIVFEPAPQTGIGPAINDRLLRASAGTQTS